MNLSGEAGLPGGGSDVLYAGADPNAGIMSGSLDYYRAKANEFQSLLVNLDRAANAAASLAFDPNTDPELASSLYDSLDEFDAKKTTLRATAGAINLAANTINAAGGRFPVLSVPQGLNLPFLVPGAIVAAVAGAVTLIAWGSLWISGVNDRLMAAQQVEGLSPVQRERIIVAQAQVTAAQNATLNSPIGFIGALSSGAKIVAVGVIAYFLWQRFGRGSARAA